MKKITSLLACIAISILSFAQAPQKFNYQGVARGSSGNVFSNQLLGFKLSVLQGSSTGTPVYVETQSVTSDSKGIFSLEVGAGTVVSGIFSSIGWGVNSYWLKTEMDTTGGSNYQTMGTTQMISVPYALYSQTTGDTSLWKKNSNDIYRLSGNVGIGTNSPSSKLHTETNSANAIGVKAMDVLGSQILLVPVLGGGGFNSLSQAGDAGIFYKSTGLGGSFVLGAWGALGGIRIDTTGKVGIGVSSAAAKLDVAGNVKIADGTEGVGKVLTSDATGLASWQIPSGGGTAGFSNMQVFQTSGTFTFTIPSGITKIMVEVWGAGGGGGFRAGGGGGGYGKGIFTVTPLTTYTVTVGSGGTGGSTGTDGGSSSLGSLISATGGFGCPSMQTGGNGGTSTAPFSINGQGAQSEFTCSTETKGDFIGGAGGNGGGGGRGASGSTGVAGVAPAGGGGGTCTNGTGGNGGDGRVVIWW